MVGMELTPNTSYHSQIDGQTEIVNEWLEGYLRNKEPHDKVHGHTLPLPLRNG